MRMRRFRAESHIPSGRDSVPQSEAYSHVRRCRSADGGVVAGRRYDVFVGMVPAESCAELPLVVNGKAVPEADYGCALIDIYRHRCAKGGMIEEASHADAEALVKAGI